MPRRSWVLAVAIICIAAATEYAAGRHLFCTCGTIDLWVGARDSPKTSQMLLDWYSASHVIHGILFYAIFRSAAPNWSVDRRFLASLTIEASWEMIENSPWIIDRYRATTAALGYSGDSILNSMSDILMMVLGFVLARRLPVRLSILVAIVLELVPLFAIRDNLTLNVWSLIAPSKALQAWQAGS